MNEQRVAISVLLLLIGLVSVILYPASNEQVSPSTALEYKNAQYGFNFSLPLSWEGYSIVTDVWKGNASAAQGPLISIRHPLWTKEVPRQDIPIMVFTIAQWNSLQQDVFHIGAAPINPSELGRNEKYVFALPARYNYAFPAGYQEVDAILQSNPLHTFSPQ